jgi:predicted choloylglycine hydrolase
MLHIKLSGSARQRGYTQGETFRAQIHELRELSQSWFQPSEKMENADEMLGCMFEYTKRHEPELIEELEGISAASNIDTLELFRMNSLSALSALGPNCTNIAIGSTEDGPLLGKTSDIGEDYRFYMLQDTTTDDGERFIGIGWVGGVWIEIGMNGHGLVIGQSSAPIAPNQDGFGIPTLVCPRPVLTKSRNVPEAVQYLQSRNMAGKGLNMMLLDKEGASAVVEKSGTYQHVRRPDSTVLFCTNHFLSDEMKDFKYFNTEAVRLNSMSRFEYLSDKAVNRPEEMNLERMQELLRSHEGPICQHNEPDLATHYAFAIAPEKLLFTVTDGYPCENEFISYRL